MAEDVAYTCETAGHFWLMHVLSRWERFQVQVRERGTAIAVQVRYMQGLRPRLWSPAACPAPRQEEGWKQDTAIPMQVPASYNVPRSTALAMHTFDDPLHPPMLESASPSRPVSSCPWHWQRLQDTKHAATHAASPAHDPNPATAHCTGREPSKLCFTAFSRRHQISNMFVFEPVQDLFPFKAYFADAPGPLFKGDSLEEDMEAAKGCWRHLRTMFQELEECRAFELLKVQRCLSVASLLRLLGCASCSSDSRSAAP